MQYLKIEYFIEFLLRDVPAVVVRSDVQPAARQTNFQRLQSVVENLKKRKHSYFFFSFNDYVQVVYLHGVFVTNDLRSYREENDIPVTCFGNWKTNAFIICITYRSICTIDIQRFSIAKPPITYNVPQFISLSQSFFSFTEQEKESKEEKKIGKKR